MKNYIIILFLLFTGVQLFAQGVPSASEVMQQAFQEATVNNKKVLLIFHASWCGWCRKMDNSLNDTCCKLYFDQHYVVRHLTVYESSDKKTLENPGALEILNKYKGKDQGIPFWLVFDSKGNLLADSQYEPGKNSGCPASSQEVDYFVQVLKKTSDISEDEMRKVRACFLKNQ